MAPNEAQIELAIGRVLDGEGSAEEVCGDDAQLLQIVKQRIRDIRRIDAELSEIFPDSERIAGNTFPSGRPLPAIPGFSVESLVGFGGMGVVYRARQMRLNRTVAIKMLLHGRLSSATEVARFEQEAKLLGAVCHPNIVQVFDFGEYEGRPYLVMEFIEGKTLGEVLDAKPQQASFAASLLKTLSGAVQIAHAAGVIHRDLKPGNVLMLANGQPKITDFGLARRIEGDDASSSAAALTRTSSRIGSPSYMAPEQARGNSDEIGPATDVYALGAILYESITGRPPFLGETISDTERQVLEMEPVAPRRLNAGCPRDLETICLKCLQKSPRLRYATASVLEDDLRRFLAREPIVARRIGRSRRLGMWVRRRPVHAALLLASTLIVGAAIAFGLWLWTDRTETRRAINVEIAAAVAAERRSDWTAARAAVERAEVRLGGRAEPQLRAELEQRKSELVQVARLDAIHIRRLMLSDRETAQFSQFAAEYEREFERAGLGSQAEPAPAVGRRVADSPIRSAWIMALDVWLPYEPDEAKRDWLASVIREVDSDNGGWRDQVRDPKNRTDVAAIARLATEVNVADAPIQLQIALGRMLAATGGDWQSYFKRLQRTHPADYWVNSLSATMQMRSGSADEAIAYARAALAARPDEAMSHVILGLALGLARQSDEELFHYRKALEIDPRNLAAEQNLAVALVAQRR
jgi:serine/threonine-protein kinase